MFLGRMGIGISLGTNIGIVMVPWYPRYMVPKSKKAVLVKARANFCNAQELQSVTTPTFEY
jgi:hypothetical protein